MSQNAKISTTADIPAPLPEKNASVAPKEAISDGASFITAGIHAAMVRLKMTNEEYD